MAILKDSETFFDGKWHCDGVIGSGSFSTVYRVYREEFGQKIVAAIKVINVPNDQAEVKSLKVSGMSNDEIKNYFYEYVKAYLEEIKLMQSLKGAHNIVIIDDYEVIERKDQLGYSINIRMELLETYDDFFNRNIITDKIVLKMGMDICTVLEYCLKKNVIHRDIKPENIFVSDMGDFKLGDFGIAKVIENYSDGLSKKGTELYMSPEVNKGEKANITIDIYSLALVLYRCFNYNRLPFYPDYPQPITYTSKNLAKEKRLKGEKIPLPKNATEEIGKIICKACSYRARDRYQSPTEFKNALKKIYDNTDESVSLSGVNNNEIDRIDSKELATTKSMFATDIDTSILEKDDLKVEHKPKKKFNVRKIVNNKMIKISFMSFLGIAVLVFGFFFLKNTDKLQKQVTSINTPLLVGKSVSDLPANIKYEITYEKVDDENLGIVLSQSIDENTKIEVNTVIKIVVGVSKNDIVVPNLVGLTVEEAKIKLDDLNLQTIINYENSEEIAKDLIISQMIKSDTKVSEGTAIELLVSKGKKEVIKTTPKFSEWLEVLPSTIKTDKYIIETRVLYRYRDKITTTAKTSTLDGYTLYHTEVSYSAWSIDKTSSTKPTASELLEIVKENKNITGYNYYHVDSKVGDKWYVNSCTKPGATSSVTHYKTFTTALPTTTLTDYCGKQGYIGVAGQGCPYNFYLWFYSGPTYSYTYTYHERTKENIYHFYKWNEFSSWQTNEITSSDSREVETKTEYRYKAR